MIFGGVHNMLEAVIHAVLLALGLILPLGVQNVFVFNQGASQSRFRNALPAVITAGVCDTVLIGLAVGGRLPYFAAFSVAYECALCSRLSISALYGLDPVEIEGGFLGRKPAYAAEAADDFCCFSILTESSCHSGYRRRDWNQLPPI